MTTKNKKTLDTLVEDIYNKLSALGKGEHLDIDEETIEQFGESMKETNDWMAISLKHSDFKEGVRSFIEKRPPNFERVTVM